MSTSNARIIPLYTTRGELDAYLIFPYIFNRSGEWIGWVAGDRKVYSVHGHYAGYFDNNPRILRKISDSFDQPRMKPPEPPAKIRPPASAPLAPMMPDLMFGIVDVLQDMPELLPSIDYGELRDDMD